MILQESAWNSQGILKKSSRNLQRIAKESLKNVEIFLNSSNIPCNKSWKNLRGNLKESSKNVEIILEKSSNILRKGSCKHLRGTLRESSKNPQRIWRNSQPAPRASEECDSRREVARIPTTARNPATLDDPHSRELRTIPGGSWPSGNAVIQPSPSRFLSEFTPRFPQGFPQGFRPGSSGENPASPRQGSF